MESHSAIRTEALLHATAWMNLKTPCSVREVEHKIPQTVSHLYEMSRVGKPIKTKISHLEGRGLSRGLGGGN